MKQLLAGAATRQITTIVVGALLVAYGLSAMLWLSFDMRPGPPPEFMAAVAQIGLTMRVLESLPATDRATVLSAVTLNGLSVREGIGPAPFLNADKTPRVGGLQHALQNQPHLANHVLSVGFERQHDGHPDRLDVVVDIDGSADRWLLFQLPPNHGRPRIPFQWISLGGITSFVAVPILVGFISLWATRRVISPLVRLAEATDGLGALLDPSPVIEEGAQEVRQVARAFNTVLERLRTFVADRTRMLASISHDLRTPLTRLKLRAEIVTDADMRKKMLNDIRKMEAMITSTLAFMRDEASVELVERVDIAVLLQTICDEFHDAGNNVCYQGSAHCAASCRPQAIQRALVNLIDNALKFEASVVVCLEVTQGEIAVTIADDGPGIPDTQKEAVFRPFFRGNLVGNDHQGSVGLGLTIVKAIIESHNGRVELSDRIPHGLCVRVCIPEIQQPAAA